MLDVEKVSDDVVKLDNLDKSIIDGLKRIIVKCTHGQYHANSNDRESFHYIVEGDGNIVKGNHDISANVNITDTSSYALHTLKCNEGSVGIGMACMAYSSVQQDPNNYKYPITAIQFHETCKLIAKLGKELKIPVTDKTMLTGAEVGPNLGIEKQYTWSPKSIPWIKNIISTPHDCGEYMRSVVRHFHYMTHNKL